MGPNGFILKLFYFNRSAPGANTNIISTSITNHVTGAATVTSYFTPSVDCYIAVQIVCATASVVNITETLESDTATTNTYGLERSSTISAGDLFGWSLIPVSVKARYNFQVETDSIIRTLKIAELQGGVAS